MNVFAKAAIAAATFTLAGQAQAVTLAYEGPAFGSYRSVTISSTPVTPVGNPVNAGAFSMTSAETGDFIAYCLDITQWLQNSSNYFETASPWSFNDLSGAMGRLQTVFDANYALVTTADASAAFQMLLWNAIYDDDNSLTTGSFAATSTAAVNALVATFTGNVAAYSGTEPQYDLTFFESEQHHSQSLVTGTPSSPTGPGPQPVPLPAGGVLLLTALAGLGLSRRKSRA